MILMNGMKVFLFLERLGVGMALAAAFSILGVARVRSVPSLDPIELGSLVRHADLIAVGRVTGLSRIARGEDFGAGNQPGDLDVFARQWLIRPSVSIAALEVERVVKGDSRVSKCYYVATSTWACDISTAEVGERGFYMLGETALLNNESPEFLRELRQLIGDSPIFQLAYYGRGRLLESNAGGQSGHVAFDRLLVMPQKLIGKEVDGNGVGRPQGTVSATELERALRDYAESHGAMLRAKSLEASRLRPSWAVTVWGDGHCEWILSDGGSGAADGLQAKDVLDLQWLKDSVFEESDPYSRAGVVAIGCHLEVLLHSRRAHIVLPGAAALPHSIHSRTSDAIQAWIAVAELSSDPETATIRAAYKRALDSAR